jgi:hypothetical protein
MAIDATTYFTGHPSLPACSIDRRLSQSKAVLLSILPVLSLPFLPKVSRVEPQRNSIPPIAPPSNEQRKQKIKIWGRSANDAFRKERERKERRTKSQQVVRLRLSNAFRNPGLVVSIIICSRESFSAEVAPARVVFMYVIVCG